MVTGVLVTVSERSSADLAREMHDLAVHLWNALWREQGENPEFVYRERVESTQGLLTELGWPDAR